MITCVPNTPLGSLKIIRMKRWTQPPRNGLGASPICKTLFHVANCVWIMFRTGVVSCDFEAPAASPVVLVDRVDLAWVPHVLPVFGIFSFFFHNNTKMLILNWSTSRLIQEVTLNCLGLLLWLGSTGSFIHSAYHPWSSSTLITPTDDLCSPILIQRLFINQHPHFNHRT